MLNKCGYINHEMSDITIFGHIASHEIVMLLRRKKVKKNKKRNARANVTPDRSIDGLGRLEWSGGKWRIKDSEAICRELHGGLMALMAIGLG